MGRRHGACLSRGNDLSGKRAGNVRAGPRRDFDGPDEGVADGQPGTSGGLRASVVAPCLHIIRAVRSVRHRNAGFTLIELLVVVAIVGSLAAIAVPVFTSRQGKAYDARVMQDARNVATAEEAYFLDSFAYFDGDCTLMPGVNISPGVTCRATDLGNNAFSIQTSHPKATRSCIWTSNASPNLTCS